MKPRAYQVRRRVAVFSCSPRSSVQRTIQRTCGVRPLGKIGNFTSLCGARTSISGLESALPPWIVHDSPAVFDGSILTRTSRAGASPVLLSTRRQLRPMISGYCSGPESGEWRAPFPGGEVLSDDSTRGQTSATLMAFCVEVCCSWRSARPWSRAIADARMVSTLWLSSASLA